MLCCLRSTAHGEHRYLGLFLSSYKPLTLTEILMAFRNLFCCPKGQETESNFTVNCWARNHTKPPSCSFLACPLFCRDTQIIPVKVSPSTPQYIRSQRHYPSPLCSVSLQPSSINTWPKIHDLSLYLLLVKTTSNTSLLHQFTQWPQQKCLGTRCDISSLCQSASLTHSLFWRLISQLKSVFLKGKIYFLAALPLATGHNYYLKSMQLNENHDKQEFHFTARIIVLKEKKLERTILRNP